MRVGGSLGAKKKTGRDEPKPVLIGGGGQQSIKKTLKDGIPRVW